MPKIGKHEFKVAGVKVYLDISYFKKEKKFAIKMPENMARALRGWSPADADRYKLIDVFGPTEDEAIHAFEKEIDAYEAAVTKKDRVILYAVAGASAEPGAERNDMEKISRELGNWGRAPEWIGLLIKHRVAYRTLVDMQVSYRDEDGSEVGYSWRPQKDGLTRVIDYTKEREEFFTSLQARLERMVDSAMSFLDQDAESMAVLIDTKKAGMLLAGPKA